MINIIINLILVIEITAVYIYTALIKIDKMRNYLKIYLPNISDTILMIILLNRCFTLIMKVSAMKIKIYPFID